MPTLIFDEVDAGIGGAVAATVGRLLQALGHAPAGALRHPPAAGRGVRRRAFPRHQARRRAKRCARTSARFQAPAQDRGARADARPAARSPRRRGRTRRSSSQQAPTRRGAERHVATAPGSDGRRAVALRRVGPATSRRRRGRTRRFAFACALAARGLGRGGRHGQRFAGLEPVPDALRVAEARVLAGRIEQHDHERLRSRSSPASRGTCRPRG